MAKPIHIKNPPAELRARLEDACKRNSNSLNQEAQHRIELSFALEDALTSKVHQGWIDEAFQKGSNKPGSVKRLRDIAARARAAAK